MLDILIEVIFRTICFPVGWPIVKLITLGKFPAKGSWFACTPESEWTSAVGVAALVIVIAAVTHYFMLS